VAPPEQPDPNAASLQQLSFSHRHSLLDKQGRLMLKSLTLSELQEWCSAVGEDARRAKQLWRWMYYDGMWAASFTETVGRQNGLSSGE
jgi:23S rRNA (adenine2503-C2)-methyltransferase